MDVFECIKTRRTIRKFTEQPIEFDKVSKIVEAATYAPSAGNIQNYRFIVVLDKSRIKSLYEYCMRQEAVYHAQVAIIVVGEDDKAERMYGLRGKRLYSIQNCACATENMLLAAHALGLGACWIGAFDEDKLRSIFNIEEHARPQAVIAIGYPDEEPVVKKKDLASFTHFNAYGAKQRDIPSLIWEYSSARERDFNNIKDSMQKKSKGLKKKLDNWMEKRKQKKEKGQSDENNEKSS